MKRLFLLRHAQALPSDGGRDRDRALTEQGLADALALGRFIKARGWTPELILCSDARRTRQTCEQILEHVTAPVTFSAEIYEAVRGRLLALLQNAGKDVNHLMMIGHNPSIYELAVMLACEGPSPLLGKLDLGYAPATLSVIDFDIAVWDDLGSENGQLLDCVSPADYASGGRPRWN